MKKNNKKMKTEKEALQRLEQLSGKTHLTGPYLNTFAASACLMILEIAAGRLIAAFVGFSIYTWTSVIGVVLSGLALGNYAGGFLADRADYRKTLPCLFVLAGIASAATPTLNHLIGNGLMFWHLPWVLKILLHVSAIFLVPSVLLGMIGPVVAKWALDKGLKKGQTVGGVYAWGAIGSVAGTFMAGFFLIPMMGTQTIMFLNASVLGGLGLFHLLRGKTLQRAAVTSFFISVTLLGVHHFGLASTGVLRPSILEDVEIVDARESQYSYIHVESSKLLPGIRVLKLDELAHGVVDMRDPASIEHAEQYDYIRLYALLTEHLFSGRSDLRSFSIGGGAYVMPRFIQRHWPKSHIEVAEIDPEVTRTAIRSLGMPEQHGLDIYHQDARNRVDDLIREGGQRFDIIYGDAFNHVSVPYHLTTREFNDKLKTLLTDQGFYVMNIIDSIETGKFLGAIYGTLSKTFPNIYVFVAGAKDASAQPWRTFVILCSLQSLDMSRVETEGKGYRLMDASELTTFEANAQHRIFTDDFAPVDHLLAGMVRERGQLTEKTLVASRLMSDSVHLVRAGKLEKALQNYQKITELDSNLAAGAYYNRGVIFAGQGKFDKAYEELNKTLEADSSFEAAREKIRQISPRLTRVKEGALS